MNYEDWKTLDTEFHLPNTAATEQVKMMKR